MKHSLQFALVAAFTILAMNANASPIPAAASSKLVSPQLGLFRSPTGFQIAAGGSGWKLVQPPQGMKHISAIYRADATPSVAEQIHNDLHSGKIVIAKNDKLPTAPASVAALTVRVDQLKKDTTIDKYVAKWMKEYPRFGFDVLGSKPFVQNNQKGVVLDLINRAQSKQLRQVVFLKNQKAVILTCRDMQTGFQASLKSCNQIIRTFEWVE